MALVSPTDVLVHNVRVFFEANPAAWDLVITYVERKRPLPDGTPPVSLRLIEYLVRTHAQRHICVTTDARGDRHDIAAEFAQQKRGRRKRAFDPFRRDGPQPITFHGRTLMTTYAQLTFFMWCLRCGVLAYAQQHRDEIERAKAAEEPDSSSSTGSRKRRRRVVRPRASAMASAVV
jgi:hypothetical protein